MSESDRDLISVLESELNKESTVTKELPIGTPVATISEESIIYVPSVPNLVLKCHTIIVTLATLALFGCSVPLLIDIQYYDKIREPLAEIGSSAAISLAYPYLLTFSILLMGIAALISCILTRKNRKQQAFCIIFILILSLSGGGSALWVGLSTLRTIDAIVVQLQSNPISSKLGELELDIIDFTSAIFNECCMSLYDNRNYRVGDVGQLFNLDGEPLDDTQRKVPQCLATVDETCPLEGENKMFPDVVSNLIESLEEGLVNDLLCYCHSGSERYDQLASIIARDNLCSSYRSLVIDDGADEPIPVIDQSFNQLLNLFANLQRTEFLDQLPIERMAVVGKMLPPKTLYKEPTENIGYSCGIGYAKGLAFQLYLYLNSKLKALLFGACFSGSSAMLASMVLFMSWQCNLSCENKSVDEYANYRRANSNSRLGRTKTESNIFNMFSRSRRR